MGNDLNYVFVMDLYRTYTIYTIENMKKRQSLETENRRLKKTHTIR